MAGVRGVSWKREEILDLLAVWGETSVQKALRESHRNKDVFDDIARAMAARGHSRSAEECRSKSKCMRQSYKRVLSHNSKSGNSPTTCPFFEELDKILNGDPTVKRRRLTQSLPRAVVHHEEGEEEITLELEAVEEGVNVERAVEVHMELLEGEEEIREVRRALQDAGEEHAAGLLNRANNQGALEDMNVVENLGLPALANIPIRNPDDIPPGVALSDLSPPSRIALREERRRKVSVMQRVGEQMIRQSSREHREMMSASQREHSELLAVLKASQEEEKNTNLAVIGLFRDALGTLSELTRGMSGYRNNGERQTSISVQTSTGPVPQDDVHPCENNPQSWSTPRGDNYLAQRCEESGRNYQTMATTRPPQSHRSLNISRPETEPEGRGGESEMGVSRSNIDTHVWGKTMHQPISTMPHTTAFPQANRATGPEVMAEYSEHEEYEDYIGTHVWGQSPRLQVLQRPVARTLQNEKRTSSRQISATITRADDDVGNWEENSQTEDSEEYVGTHVWGQSQRDPIFGWARSRAVTEIAAASGRPRSATQTRCDSDAKYRMLDNMMEGDDSYRAKNVVVQSRKENMLEQTRGDCLRSSCATVVHEGTATTGVRPGIVVGKRVEDRRFSGQQLTTLHEVTEVDYEDCLSQSILSPVVGEQRGKSCSATVSKELFPAQNKVLTELTSARPVVRQTCDFSKRPLLGKEGISKKNPTSTERVEEGEDLMGRRMAGVNLQTENPTLSAGLDDIFPLAASSQSSQEKPDEMTNLSSEDNPGEVVCNKSAENTVAEVGSVVPQARQQYEKNKKKTSKTSPHCPTAVGRSKRTVKPKVVYSPDL